MTEGEALYDQLLNQFMAAYNACRAECVRLRREVARLRAIDPDAPARRIAGEARAAPRPIVERYSDDDSVWAAEDGGWRD